MRKVQCLVLLPLAMMIMGAATLDYSSFIHVHVTDALLSSDAAVRAIVDGYSPNPSDYSAQCKSIFPVSAVHDVSYGARDWYVSHAVDHKSMEKMESREKWSTREAARGLIMEELRGFLKDPEKLKSIYLASKSKLVAHIARRKINAVVKDDLRQAMPLLTGRLTSEQRTLLLEYKADEDARLADYARLDWQNPKRKELLDFGCKLDGALIENSKGFFALPRQTLEHYEWIERRRKEGGDKLVAMYAWIAQDLLESI
jgi:hypothetical protein